jgi:hypothetical protein
MNKSMIIASALFLTMVSCVQKEKDDSVYKINADEAVSVDINEVATDFRIIPVNADVPIDMCNEIQFYDEYILMMNTSKKMIYILDKNGNLLNTLDRAGRGPGEYIEIYRFCLWEKENILYLFDDDNILSYSIPDLEFIRKSSSNIRYEQFNPIGNSMCLARGIDDNRDNFSYFNSLVNYYLFDFADWNDTTIIYSNTRNEFFGSDYNKCTNRSNYAVTIPGQINKICVLKDGELKPLVKFTLGPSELPSNLFDKKMTEMEDIAANDQYNEMMHYFMLNRTQWRVRLPIVNNEVVSFLYEDMDLTVRGSTVITCVISDKKVAQYNGLLVPGLTFNMFPDAVDGVKYVVRLDYCDPKSILNNKDPLCPLAQQIYDAYNKQTNENPIFLEFMMKAPK